MRLVDDGSGKGEGAEESASSDFDFLRKIEADMLSQMSLRGVEGIKRVFMRHVPTPAVDETGTKIKGGKTDFWGLQPKPDTQATGLKSIDSWVKPANAMVRDMTAMHNAVVHLTSTMKSFAAATMSAPICESAGFVRELPSLNIVKLSDDPSAPKFIIASLDCERGLFKHPDALAEYEAIDKAGVNPIAVSALLESTGEWLLFLRAVLDAAAGRNFELGLVDETCEMPLVHLKDTHATHEPWVRTRIKYDGFFGFCST